MIVLVSAKFDPAIRVPLFVSTEHVLDLMRPAVNNSSAFRRWWVEAQALGMVPVGNTFPDFTEFQMARQLLYAVKQLSLRRALSRREALEKARLVPLELLPLVAGIGYSASEGIDQLLYNSIKQETVSDRLVAQNARLEARVSALEAKLSRMKSLPDSSRSEQSKGV